MTDYDSDIDDYTRPLGPDIASDPVFEGGAPDTVSRPSPRRRRPVPVSVDAEPTTSDMEDTDTASPSPNPPRPRRQPTQRASRTQVPPPSAVRLVHDKRFKAFLGTALVLLGGLMGLFILSYFRTGAADQSMAMNMTINQMAQTPDQVANLGGPVGAKVSHMFITQWLGLGSLAVVVYLMVMGLALVGWIKAGFWSATFQTLLIAITASVVLGYAAFTVGTPVWWGGMHGHAVTAWLNARLGIVGAPALCLLLLAAVLLVYLDRIATFWRARQAEFKARRNRHRQAEEQLRRQAQEADQRLTTEMDDSGHAVHAVHADHTDHTDVLRPSQPESSLTTLDEILAPSAPAPAPQETAPEAVPKEDPPLDIQAAASVAAASSSDLRDTALYDPTAELSRYHRPDISLLREDTDTRPCVDRDEQEQNKQRIIKTLQEYDIPVQRIQATVGPTVTLFEIVPAEGVRIAAIKRLEDDIARSLAAIGIRIIAPIPGKGTVGIEVPNHDPRTVTMRTIISSEKFQNSKMHLPMAIGTTVQNEVVVEDLTKMPHLLVAGATGQGKSVGLNAIITALLYKRHPAELKFVLIDPKMVEFSLYARIDHHFLAKLPGDDNDPIVTDPEKAKAVLASLCIEMDLRYALLKDAYVRSVEEYNTKFVNHSLNPEKGHRYLPYIVVVVDEFADLIMMSGKEVEMPIARIAQKARAVGIHMIIATQRPSTNIITGIIKANFPGRIAFRVSQMVDSKTILDRSGANQLIGRGDMLFSHDGKMERVQCAFIDTPEVEAITRWIEQQPGYDEPYILPEVTLDGNDAGAVAGANFGDRDGLFDECARFIVQSQTASTSSLQRRYAIGYNRAGKIMDQLEAAGVVGPSNGGKPRPILMDSVALEALLTQGHAAKAR